MFPMNLAALPTLRTRQALLILDLQNDFVSPDGALAIPEAGRLVSRVVKLAKAFRESGAGDVIWIRSQFDGHRPLIAGADSGDRIITTDAPVIPRRPSSSRGRPSASGRHEQAIMEADEEAFLSSPPGSQKPVCVRPDTDGFELVAEVQQAVDSSKDIIFTKTHYSAFAAGQQLLQLLRGRFVTELYVCGALTNVSIYATGLDAASHGYEITLIDDCCGYRSDMRHSNAVHRLMHLTGCEVTTAEDAMAKWKPEKTKSDRKARRRLVDTEKVTGDSRTVKGAVESSASKEEKPPVGPMSAAYLDDFSNALRSSLEKLTLSGETSAAPSVPSGHGAQPQLESANPIAALTTPMQVQAMVESSKHAPVLPETPKSPTIAAQPVVAGPSRIRVTPHVDNTPLEVDPDLLVEPPSPEDGDSRKRGERVRIEAKMSSLSRAFNRRGPPRVLIPARSSLAVGSSTRTVDAAKLRTRPSEPSLSQHDREQNGIKPSASAPQLVSDEARNPGLLSPQVDDRPEQSSGKPTTPPTMDEQPTLPPADPQPTSSQPLCEGDTTIITNVLPPSLATTAFDSLKTEVAWNRMSHQGGEVPRLVAVQGTVDSEGNYPIYRHPADESPPLLPFSPTVLAIKTEVEKQLGHELNHVLIQFYRSGQDYISEHSDKTLDIAKDSFICNVSLGAERTMVFRTKRLDKDPSRKGKAIDTAITEESTDGTKRRIQRAPLPHNSLIRMGLTTNMRWLHAIRQDKRLDNQKSPAEMAHNGERISLTFRLISTYTDVSQSLIWGQGATSKSRSTAGRVINGQTDEAISMLQSFGTENHSSDFDWEGYYGAGFNVVHIKAAPRLFSSADPVVNLRVAMQLSDLGIGYAKGSTGGSEAGIRFVDNDTDKSIVEGEMAVMLYLDAVYNQHRSGLARRYTRFQTALGLLGVWRSVPADDAGSGQAVGRLKGALGVWEGFALQSESEMGGMVYMAGGDRASIVDYALWPVLHQIMRYKKEILDGFPGLGRYYELMRGGKGVVKVLGEKE